MRLNKFARIIIGNVIGHNKIINIVTIISPETLKNPYSLESHLYFLFKQSSIEDINNIPII